MESRTMIIMIVVSAMFGMMIGDRIIEFSGTYPKVQCVNVKEK